MPASCHLCLTSCKLGTTLLELEEDILDHHQLSAPLFSSVSYPMGFCQADALAGQSLLLQSCSWPCSLLQEPQLSLLIPSSYSPDQLFLACNMVSRRAPPLTGSSLTLVRKMLSTNSKSLLDGFHLAVLPVQQILA